MKQRILQYIDFKGINKNVFYKETGLSNGFLDKKGSIGVDKLEKILLTYSEINVEWLITGNGNMLKKEVLYTQNNIENIINEPKNMSPSQELLLQEIKNLKNMLKIITEERDFLREILKPSPLEKRNGT